MVDPKEVAEYVQTSQSLLQEFKEANDKLTEELTALQGQAKEASASPLVEDKVKETVENAISAGFLKQAEQEEAVSQILTNPSVLLEFIDKLAANAAQSSKQVRSMGRPSGHEKVASAASGRRESDRVFEERFDRLSKSY
jgi:hypothetical protein